MVIALYIISACKSFRRNALLLDNGGNLYHSLRFYHWKIFLHLQSICEYIVLYNVQYFLYRNSYDKFFKDLVSDRFPLWSGTLPSISYWELFSPLCFLFTLAARKFGIIFHFNYSNFSSLGFSMDNFFSSSLGPEFLIHSLCISFTSWNYR